MDKRADSASTQRQTRTGRRAEPLTCTLQAPAFNLHKTRQIFRCDARCVGGV